MFIGGGSVWRSEAGLLWKYSRGLSRVGLANTIWKEKGEAGQVVPPPHVPFQGCPASLTEGG
jgi:hypothetical protein